MSRTYLYTCLKDNLLCRWPDAAMPVNVYIAPFTWYEKKKQQESLMYRQMVLDALDSWRKATNNLVRFNIVTNLNNSQIDFKWRRVDRRTLGHCVYETDKQYRLFSAEIQIGISDGLLHAEYQDAMEVKHTILHEIGHALGLIDHSDGPDDIMYVPHKYGVFTLSPRDIETIGWLYKLPIGFNYKSVGAKYHLKTGYDINNVIDKIEQRILENKGSKAKESQPESQYGIKNGEVAAIDEAEAPPSLTERKPRNTRSLEEQHEILSEMGRFYLKTQNIRIDKKAQDELRRAMMDKKLRNYPSHPEL